MWSNVNLHSVCTLFFSTADAHKMDIFTEFSTDASAFVLKGLWMIWNSSWIRTVKCPLNEVSVYVHTQILYSLCMSIRTCLHEIYLSSHYLVFGYHSIFFGLSSANVDT